MIATRTGTGSIHYQHMDSPIGELLVATSDEGLVRLGLPSEDWDSHLAELRGRGRLAEGGGTSDAAVQELEEYFAGERTVFAMPLDWGRIDGFRRAVLDRMYEIPYGETVTYAELAARAGNPRASRAAGHACATNPLPIVVPCHRVLRTGGGLGGYGGGLPAKRYLLHLEGVFLSAD